MPTRTKTEPEAAAGNVAHVILVDAVNVTTGRKPNGRPQVARMYRGQILNAPADHPSIVDLVGMGAAVPVADAAETVKALAKRGNAKRPTAQQKDEKGYRVTANGIAVTMSNIDDPALNPVAEAGLPMDGSTPDLATTVDA